MCSVILLSIYGRKFYTEGRPYGLFSPSASGATMTFNPRIMTTVEQLDYRVTVGDVAARAGLDIDTTQRGLLALASEVSANLQVSEAGEIAYLFPKNFRAVLRQKYLRLRLRSWWVAVWKVLFYLIRISFGIFLLVSITLVMAALAIIVISIQSSQDNDRRRSSGSIFIPHFWFNDLFYFFYPSSHRRARQPHDPDRMNFFEATFSFLFGDGNPNANLEERRWQTIGAVIRGNGGAVVAEQIVPYLDLEQKPEDDEYYMLPVLTRFDGVPEVSPVGGIVYRFPELQSTATQRDEQAVPLFLQEFSWPFSQASSGQITLDIGLGMGLVVLSLILGTQAEAAVAIGGFVAVIQALSWVFLGYGIAFLGVPLVRYFWLQRHNANIESRNSARQDSALALANADASLEQKIKYARQFAAQSVVTRDRITYTTEQDLLDQEFERERQRRLQRGDE